MCLVFSLNFIPDKNKRLSGVVLVLDSLFHHCCIDNSLFSDKGRFDSMALHVIMLASEARNHLFSHASIPFVSEEKYMLPPTFGLFFNPSPRKISLLHCRRLGERERVGTTIDSEFRLILIGLPDSVSGR